MGLVCPFELILGCPWKAVLLYYQHVLFCIFCVFVLQCLINSFPITEFPLKQWLHWGLNITNSPFHFLVFLRLCRSMSIIALVVFLALCFNSTVLSTSCLMGFILLQILHWGQGIHGFTARETLSWTTCSPIPNEFPMLISLKAYLQLCFSAWFGWSSFLLYRFALYLDCIKHLTNWKISSYQ